MTIQIPTAAPLAAYDRWWPDTTTEPLVLHARKTVDATEPSLRGHFPRFPIYPGVFVLETLSQLVRAGLPGGTARLCRVSSLRLVAPLLVGDELSIEATARPQDGSTWEVSATGTRRDGSVCATMRVTCTTDGRSAPAGAGVLEHPQVRALLPQRFPMLLVDRVLELRAGESITTIKAITANEPCYADLPDDADPSCFAYPVSLLVESLGQSAALLWQHSEQPAEKRGPHRHLLFLTARGYEVSGEAHPGDVVRHVVRLDQVVADTGFCHGESWVGDRRIARVETLMAAQRPDEQLR
ncbi:3-hydroxyacyl-ACP dehydratase FabZ family protein [Micromonospora andamanensis]|uniref:ApeI dehydratase-like domain-containing protein n=1 Tax=Micromonospora andamanensis TaxID=1287068 RepID=A0ABQ4HTE3_9ACTN|nr:hypothetical protein [Micromonospora andamanensis]GIJ08928.1 hypothetical protein Van01_21420 [Micromonospora andamanensis]